MTSDISEEITIWGSGELGEQREEQVANGKQL
jgi:hypothetical protein